MTTEYMTAERREQIEKDTLWEYTRAKADVSIFHASFNNHADKFAELAKTLREDPAKLSNCSNWLATLQEYLADLPTAATGYRLTVAKQIEKRKLFEEMCVALPEGY